MVGHHSAGLVLKSKARVPLTTMETGVSWLVASPAVAVLLVPSPTCRVVPVEMVVVPL